MYTQLRGRIGFCLSRNPHLQIMALAKFPFFPLIEYNNHVLKNNILGEEDKIKLFLFSLNRRNLPVEKVVL